MKYILQLVPPKKITSEHAFVMASESDTLVDLENGTERGITLVVMHGEQKISINILPDPPMTVGQLKTRIQTQLNIAPENQRLFFNGQELSDDKILQIDIKIQNHSTFLLHCRTNPIPIPNPNPNPNPNSDPHGNLGGGGGFSEDRVMRVMRLGSMLRMWAILQAVFSFLAALWSPYPSFLFVTLFAIVSFFGAKYYHFVTSLMFVPMSAIDMGIRIYQVTHDDGSSPLMASISVFIDFVWIIFAAQFLNILIKLTQPDRDEITRRPSPSALPCCSAS